MVAVRMQSVVVAVTLAAIFAAAQSWPSSTAIGSRVNANDFTLVLRERIGAYRYWRTLETGRAYDKAIAIFGARSAVGKETPQSNVCTVRWERIGLDIGFAGAVERCSPRSLRRAAWYGMRLWGSRWRTARGLRVGDTIAKMRQLYPKARYRSDPPRSPEWWLITADQAEFGQKPLLVAEVGAGRVVAIRVPAGYVF